MKFLDCHASPMTGRGRSTSRALSFTPALNHTSMHGGIVRRGPARRHARRWLHRGVKQIGVVGLHRGVEQLGVVGLHRGVGQLGVGAHRDVQLGVGPHRGVHQLGVGRQRAWGSSGVGRRGEHLFG